MKRKNFKDVNYAIVFNNLNYIFDKLEITALQKLCKIEIC
jgi:hypothetical protein